MSTGYASYDRLHHQFLVGVRAELVEKLLMLPDGWQQTFRRMYAKRGEYEATKDQPFAQFVTHIPEKQLPWALQQVDNSMNKLTDLTRGP